MKSLSKPKHRTSAELVRHTRVLLYSINVNAFSRASKREEKESSKTITFDAFHVFKLFVANQNKPPEIISILTANGSKLLRFFNDFKIDKEDEQFEADKAKIIKEIISLQSKDGL